MSIMDIFRTQPVAPVAPAGTNQPQKMPGNLPENAGAVDPNNSLLPAGSADALKSPLDVFDKLWDTDPNAANSNKPFSFNIDPEKLKEAASKTDFSRVLTPENLQRIAAGGTESVQAFQESLNQVAQTVYAQSAFANSKMVEAAVLKATEDFNLKIPQLLKQHSLSDSLRNKNPALSHPAANPIVKAMEYQLAQKYPDATATDLSKMAEDYLVAFASSISPVKEETIGKPGAKSNDVDWSNFLN